MERMPENMRLEIIKKLSEIGTQVPAGRTPMDRPGSNPVKEAGMLLEAIKRSVGLRGPPASNPVKAIGELLEALEHIARYFKEKHASDRAQPQ
jgi:hypothetical protein